MRRDWYVSLKDVRIISVIFSCVNKSFRTTAANEQIEKIVRLIYPVIGPLTTFLRASSKQIKNVSRDQKKLSRRTNRNHRSLRCRSVSPTAK